MKDKRKSLRRHTSYSVWLALDGDAQHVCALLDISETGARLEVESADVVPDRFLLLLSGNGAARRKCRVVWRNDRQVGVAFEPRLVSDEHVSLAPAFDADTPSNAADSVPAKSG
jgi:hypothetical protein